MSRFRSGNRIKLLENGTAYFPALEAALDSASHEIYFETYIFEPDTTGQRIAAALKRAALRGVHVHLTIDGFGSRILPPAFIQDLQEAGVQVIIFRPEIAPFRVRRYRLRRLHRKIVLVDTRVAFVGGINIIDDINTPGQIPPRFDYAVEVEGPLIGDIWQTVRRLWLLVSWTHLKQHWLHDGTPGMDLSPAGDMRAAFLIRDNIRHRREIEEAYLRAIGKAKKEIVIANAYFLPGINFRHELTKASARGVRVILLLQGRVEYFLLHYASHALYGNLLNAGVEIYEYHKSFLHAKVAVIDGVWATVGSSNIDPFSLLLSREANVVVRNRRFAVELRKSLQLAMDTGASQIRPEAWKQERLWRRALTWLSYGMVRLMMGMAGYAYDAKHGKRGL